MSIELKPNMTALDSSTGERVPFICGTVNTATGEFKEGYVDKSGNLAYRNPLPWYKRLFGMKAKQNVWGKWEFVSMVKTKRHMDSAFGGYCGSVKTTAAVYRRVNVYTGKEQYMATDAYDSEYIDPSAWKRGYVVPLLP